MAQAQNGSAQTESNVLAELTYIPQTRWHGNQECAKSRRDQLS